MSVLIPVALFFGKDNVSGRDVSEQSDRRLLPACLPVLIQRMVVIVNLLRGKKKKKDFIAYSPLITIMTRRSAGTW